MKYIFLLSISLLFTLGVMRGWSQIHVSPSGNDAVGDGSAAHPYQTVQKGVEKSRELPQASKVVLLDDGSYERTSVVLGPQDSGLQLRAAKGAKPLLLGGFRVTGWQKEKASECYSVSLPGVKEGTLDFRTLVVNGELAPRARFPAKSAFQNEAKFDVPWLSTTAGGFARKPTYDELTTLRYRPGDLGSWLDLKNAEFTIYHVWDDSLVNAASLDANSRVVRFKQPCVNPPGSFKNLGKAGSYVIWNVRQGMTYPGQWYLDRTEGKLVYWPKPGEDMNKLDVIAPNLFSILRIEGTAEKPVRDLTVQGIAFSATTIPLKPGSFASMGYEGAITGQWAEHFTAEGVTIKNVGGNGIRLDQSANAVIRGCDISYVGAGGIYLLFDDNANACNGLVERNTVRECGLQASGVGIFVSGSRNRITHNLISGTSYSGISASGGSSTVCSDNRISNYMRGLDDGGGIYITFCENYTVSGNYIVGSKIPSNERHGIYLDESARGCRVNDNIVLDEDSAVLCHMATDSLIINNLFLTEGECHLIFDASKTITFQQNIVQAGQSIHFIHNEGTTFKKDIFSPKEGGIWQQPARKAETRWKPTNGSVVGNPHLVRKNEWSYGFEPESLADQLGVKPIDVEQSGFSDAPPAK